GTPPPTCSQHVSFTRHRLKSVATTTNQNKRNETMDLITLTDPRSPISEAYRTLRTNLSFYGVDTPIRTLVVTSPNAEAGKSTTEANLAVTMAQSGRRTIVVDCDLSRLKLHEFLKVENGRGRNDMVLDETLAPPLQPTGVDKLWLITSGTKPPNPA